MRPWAGHIREGLELMLIEKLLRGIAVADSPKSDVKSPSHVSSAPEIKVKIELKTRFLYLGFVLEI